MATILLDMDGVLTDFAGAVCALFGQEPPGPAHRGKDLAAATGIRAGQMWPRIDDLGAKFWRELEPTPFANELVSLCRKAGEVVIATSPSNDPAATAGKIAWLQQRFGKRFRDFVVSPRKELLAAPGRLLVDDTPKHVDAFRVAGGQAVLLPTWHNGELAEGGDPLDPVRTALAALGAG